jgi:hypothetical protein
VRERELEHRTDGYSIAFILRYIVVASSRHLQILADECTYDTPAKLTPHVRKEIGHARVTCADREFVTELI